MNLIAPLPQEPPAILALTWADYEQRFGQLAAHVLSPATVEAWLDAWTAVADRLEEHYTRLYVATTRDTADTAVQAAYDTFVEQIQTPARAAEQRLKAQLLGSGLQPPGFTMGLKKLATEAALFREDNLPLLAEEQKLGAEYNKVLGAVTVVWEGQERTLSQMIPVLYEQDRTVREKAWRASLAARLTMKPQVHDLWSRFVPLREKIAANAGLPEYRAYVWDQRFRFDYSPQDCLTFHASIEAEVVPAVRRLQDKRRRALGLATLRPWDMVVDPYGAPALRPYLDLPELLDRTEAVFTRVDPAFGRYFRLLRDQDLLDLDSRKNKGPGGYNLIYNTSKQPFIFMNASGTADDVTTLLHEGGHAFHAFEAAAVRYFHERSEDFVPIEFAEVASMAMELLASPYLGQAQGGYYSEADAARARLEHAESVLEFWPYMALVDAFQHWVYENPRAAAQPDRADQEWARLWDRFMAGVDFTGVEAGRDTYWHRQLHIHVLPFYYVEYGMAQLGAVQVWGRAQQDQAAAVAAYRRALALGSTVGLPQLFEAAGIRFAFDRPTLASAVGLLEEQISRSEAVLGR